MSRNRIIYQNEALYAGPSLKTGIATGVLLGHHILKKIDNVIAATYGINIERQDIMQLGSEGILARPSFKSPVLDLQFSYLFNGFSNETKLGLNTNFSTGNDNVPRYNDTFSAALLSGFLRKDRARDKRDFFMALADEGEDVFNGTMDSPYGNNLTTLTGIIDNNSPTFDILNFQDCYLTKYNMSIETNKIVTCNLSYLASNMMVFVSGSGLNVFTLDKKNKTAVKTGINIVIPKFSRSTENIILSNSCTLSITPTGSTPVSTDIGLSLNDAKFSSFNLDINLERYSLSSISHKMPLDSPIKFPVIASFSVKGIQGDALSGDYLSFINADRKIDLSVSMNRIRLDSPKGDLSSKIFIKNATVNSIFFDSSIGSNKSFTIQGQVDLDSSDLSKGLFFSGDLPTGIIEEFLLKNQILDI